MCIYIQICIYYGYICNACIYVATATYGTIAYANLFAPADTRCHASPCKFSCFPRFWTKCLKSESYFFQLSRLFGVLDSFVNLRANTSSGRKYEKAWLTGGGSR